ncbi:hypothetical protein [Streptomyces sp. NPDC090621]|uniref:hypothetical protein n=1 Tax=Streptomyces sp. NPDC090621 TaxID=3365966 RepID=UPI0038026C03
MTEGRPHTAASGFLWEREAEIATVTEAIEVLCADQASTGSLLLFRGEAGLDE